MADSVLLKARQHFRNLRTVEALRKIDVPEWDSSVYYWPEMSVEERRAVYAHLKVGGSGITAGDLTAASLAQVLARARDAHGARLFRDEDEKALADDTSADVLQRIAAEMGWSNGGTVEDAEKN